LVWESPSCLFHLGNKTRIYAPNHKIREKSKDNHRAQIRNPPFPLLLLRLSLRMLLLVNC